VAANNVLNFEANPSHNITVRITDNSGAFTDRTYSLQVKDINESPTQIGTVSGTNLVSNNSFETNTTGWTLSGNVARASGISSDGTFALGFNNSNSANTGVATTTIATTVGQTYQVGFDLGAWGSGTGLQKSQLLKAEAIGSTTLATQYSYDFSTTTATFARKYFTFVADSTTTTLRFSDVSTITTSVDMYLDQIDVRQVETTAPSLSVAENSANGTVVGTAAGIDREQWASLTYSLVDNAGGRFAINSSTGQVTVANGSLLNFEAAASHNIVVRATDQGGLTVDRTVTITVTDVNEAPTITFGNVVGDYRDDYRQDAPLVTGWRYLWNAPTGWSASTSNNASNPIGNPIGYSALLDAGAIWTVDGDQNATNDQTGCYLQLNGAGGHPGVGSLQAAGSARAAIAAFTVNATGNYSITDSFFQTWNSSDGLTLYVHIDGNSFSRVTKFTQNQSMNFDMSLGTLSAGQTVYVIASSDGYDYSDSFAWDFSFRREQTISVAENSANGTTVTTVRGVDQDANSAQTYTLLDNAGGRFAINSTTGVLTVANGSLLDFETNQSHTIIVQSQDSGGLIGTRTLTVSVTNVNEAPVFGNVIVDNTTFGGQSTVSNTGQV
ncbi:MAG: cadherin domain-containing protein, partial [Planctomycetes bacterium]|nr:cadherin domain-containing protein [Planctomycetota bacterium]